jgi:hypothetical protein
VRNVWFLAAAAGRGAAPLDNRAGYVPVATGCDGSAVHADQLPG